MELGEHELQLDITVVHQISMTLKGTFLYSCSP
jgi:hypothetical protein